MFKDIQTPSTSGELLDVVDQHGDPTGEVVDKTTIHEQGLPHRDVHVWVTDGENYLEQQRTWDKAIMPGAWDISVGGHVSTGETYLDAAVRETGEELGLERPPEQFVYIGTLATKVPIEGWQEPHNIVGDNFVLVEPGLALDDLQLQTEEVVAARWYPIDQLETDLQRPDTAQLHAPQPEALYRLGIMGMRNVIDQ